MICVGCGVDKDEVKSLRHLCDKCRAISQAFDKITRILALYDDPHWTINSRERIRELANDIKHLLS